MVVVDNQVDVVLDVDLSDQTGGFNITEFIRTHFRIAKLVDLVTLEYVAALKAVEQFVGAVVLGYTWIKLRVLFLVVVRDGVVVGQVQDQFLVQFLNGDIGSVRTRNNLKAVVEQGLRLVVSNAHQLN